MIEFIHAALHVLEVAFWVLFFWVFGDVSYNDVRRWQRAARGALRDGADSITGGGRDG